MSILKSKRIRKWSQGKCKATDNVLLRQPILDAAQKLFAHEGYENVSMRRIGAEVGCSPMAMYRYFGSKEELLISLCEEVYAGLTEMRDIEAEKLMTPVEKVRTTLRTFIEFGINHPNHYKLIFMTDMPSGPVARRKAAIMRRGLDELKEQVTECVENTGLELDVELITQVLRVGAQGMIAGSIAKTFGRKDKKRLMNKLIETLTGDLE
jgi:AcrR family transcriptional regulator